MNRAPREQAAKLLVKGITSVSSGSSGWRPCVMHDSVDGVHTLLGSRLRDARRGREGRIVGIDQTQPTPALLIVWASGQGVERVGLSREELQALVEASMSRQSRKQSDDDCGGAAPDGLDVVSLAIKSSKQS